MPDSTIVPNDLSSFWMPFTANRSFKKNPRLLASADRMHYKTPEGREILDGTAGLWCVNAGHKGLKLLRLFNVTLKNWILHLPLIWGILKLSN